MSLTFHEIASYSDLIPTMARTENQRINIHIPMLLEDITKL